MRQVRSARERRQAGGALMAARVSGGRQAAR
jgi:hypothetical protein